MKKTVQKVQIYALLFIAALISLVNLGYSQAATGGTPNGFTISPVLTEVTINPGTTYTDQITIQNPTSGSTVAHAIINDFVASTQENGEPSIILKPNAPLPANNFISLVNPIPDTPLGPQQQTVINVTLTVPKNANPGGYYGTIRFAPVQTTQGGNVGLTASVGSLFLITVPGNLIQKLTLTQLSAANSSGETDGLFTSGKVSIITRLDNVGNIHVQPYGTIEVKNMFGSIVATSTINNVNPRGNILPDSIRKFTSSLPSKLHLLGYYSITASIAYGNGSGNVLLGKASFWYIPVWLMIVLILIVIIIVSLVYMVVLKFKKRKFNKRIR